jgi:hypothetical protein
MQRRTLLSTLSTVGAVTIVGCIGGGDEDPQFSTEGNDSELIQSAPEELILTVEDLPGNRWKQQSSVANQRIARQVFRRPTSQDSTETEGIILSVKKATEVSTAEERYAKMNPEYLTGQTVEPDESRELAIGVESMFYAWQSSMFYAWQSKDQEETQNLLKMRDANVFCRLLWVVTGGPKESIPADSVTLEQIGTLGVTVHQKWR